MLLLLPEKRGRNLQTLDAAPSAAAASTRAAFARGEPG
jgi:hypothetical protein